MNLVVVIQKPNFCVLYIFLKKDILRSSSAWCVHFERRTVSTSQHTIPFGLHSLLMLLAHWLIIIKIFVHLSSSYMLACIIRYNLTRFLKFEFPRTPWFASIGNRLILNWFVDFELWRIAIVGRFEVRFVDVLYRMDIWIIEKCTSSVSFDVIEIN